MFGSLLVLLADTILPFFRTPILPWFGEPIHPILSIFVAEYYCIFVFGVPFFMLFFIRWEFLAAHEITKPLVVVFVPSFPAASFCPHQCIGWLRGLASRALRLH